MAKVVRYNGGNISYYSCTEPTELVVGQEYEVTSVRDRGWQTDYMLKGIEGNFNSCWFDELYTTVDTYMAVSRQNPVVGRRCECAKLVLENGMVKFVNCSTSPVMQAINLGNNVYRVTTKNSIYIVQVG